MHGRRRRAMAQTRCFSDGGPRARNLEENHYQKSVSACVRRSRTSSFSRVVAAPTISGVSENPYPGRRDLSLSVLI